MIVKVQISLYSSEHVKMMLVYNEDRTVMEQWQATDDILTIMEMRPKAYFEAEIGSEGQLVILEEAENQNW